jgi:hypothetical protein
MTALAKAMARPVVLAVPAAPQRAPGP